MKDNGITAKWLFITAVSEERRGRGEKNTLEEISGKNFFKFNINDKPTHSRRLMEPKQKKNEANHTYKGTL